MAPNFAVKGIATEPGSHLSKQSKTVKDERYVPGGRAEVSVGEKERKDEKTMPMVISIGIVVMFLILGCAATTSGEKGGALYSEKDLDIQAKVGTVFTIRLEANETTGYTWRGNEQFDRSYLELTGSPYQPAHPQRPGSGGEQRYHFKALKAGTTEIRLTYKRSWEATPSDKTVVFTVRISNP